MTKLALFSLVTLFIAAAAHAQDVQPASRVGYSPPTPEVTFDVTGTYPANMPPTALTAPNASFLMELTFPQTVPAVTVYTFLLAARIVSGTYSFEGKTYHATNGAFIIQNHENNKRDLSMVTPAGSIGFHSQGQLGSIPDLPFRRNPPTTLSSSGSVTFLTGDFGAGGTCNITFTNPQGQSITGYQAKVSDVVGRLVMPKPTGLAAAP